MERVFIHVCVIDLVYQEVERRKKHPIPKHQIISSVCMKPNII